MDRKIGTFFGRGMSLDRHSISENRKKAEERSLGEKDLGDKGLNQDSFNYEMRRSFFSPNKNVFSNRYEDVIDMDIEDGVNVIKKRRGSIFGNGGDTVLGN